MTPRSSSWPRRLLRDNSPGDLAAQVLVLNGRQAIGEVGTLEPEELVVFAEFSPQRHTVFRRRIVNASAERDFHEDRRLVLDPHVNPAAVTVERASDRTFLVVR